MIEEKIIIKWQMVGDLDFKSRRRVGLAKA
jgi:hypothetical protein